MRSKFAFLMLLVLGPVVAAQQPARPPANTQKLPPLVYICTMAGDEGVLEDKPGRCPNPKCGMELVPIRLDSKFWCPTHQTLVVRDAAGKCPLDGKELVQVTLAVSWTCADNPDKALTEPTTCKDGKPSPVKYEIRAHGDHNPKHGGQFFMAEDAWHHIEGTYPSAGLFRVHFYDNFTKPMSARAFSGSAVVLDSTFKEIASYPLRLSRNGQTMEAQIPPAHAALPLNAAARIKFGPNMKEQLFNFPFQKYTVEPVAPAPAPSTTGRATPAAPRPAAPAATTTRPAPPSGTPAANATRPAPATPAAPNANAAGAAAGGAPPAAPPAAQAAPAAQAPLILDSPLAMPPGLAEATDETRLPSDTAGLIAELESRAKEVETLVNEGSLAQVWLPAMGTKTVALALDQRAGNLPERQRTAIAAAVKQIVLASWEIDSYGDLGNRQKITEAYSRLAAAVANLRSQYAQ